MDKLNCITLNVRGLHNKDKRIALFEFLKQKNVNIACLQETYCTNDFMNTFKAGWEGQIFHSYAPSNHSKGVCILIDAKFDYNVLSIHHDTDGRKIMINIEIDNQCYTIISVYCPNREYDRIAFLKKLSKWTSDKCTSFETILCGGDFNCVLNEIDRKNHTGCDKSTKYLNKYMSTFNLIDFWHKINTDTIAFTFIDPSNRGFDSRIDFMFMSKAIYSPTHTCSIIPAPVPDHNAVLLCLCLQENKRGAGYWKMNVSVLDEEEYVHGIKDVLANTFNDYEEVGKKLVWELCKVRIREFTISYCTQKKQSCGEKIKNLETQLRTLSTDYTQHALHEKSQINEKLK